MEPGVGDHEIDHEGKSTHVLDFGNYPLMPAPTLGLIVQISDLDLDAALGQPSEVRRHQLIKVLVGRQPDGVGDALFPRKTRRFLVWQRRRPPETRKA